MVQERDTKQVGAQPSAPADRDAWLRSILEHAPEVISILSPEGKILFLSRTAVGRDPEGYIGKDAGAYLSPEERMRWDAALREAIASGSPRHIALESSGGFSWETRIAPIKAPDGTQVLLTIGTNVTAQRDAENALRESAETLRRALAASQVGLWSWDVASDDVLWDEASTRVFGQNAPIRTRDEFISVLHPDDRERVGAAIGRALETGVYEDLECRAVGADGKLRAVLIRGEVARYPDGRPKALHGAAVDITAQKQLEEQLRQAVKMDAVGQLAGGVAHDFNNLMLIIMSSVTLAAAASSKEQRDDFLDQIKTASERAAALTRQLLVLSRRQPLQRGIFDLNDLAGDMLRLLRRVVPASIEIDFVPGNLLGPVAGDRSQIEQVLMNLCVNARDAMPSGGRLTIMTQSALDERGARRFSKLSVSDTGRGMSPEVQARVFEPFFTTKAPGKGTGLGLAVAYGIVKQHDGRLKVESTPGRGSAFEVWLPVAVEHRLTESIPESDPLVSGGHEGILVAEDDDGVRNVVDRILRDAGYRVIVTTNGEDAVRAHEEASPPVDLVLFDAVMPRMGGLDALERIRALRPQIRAIITSGYSDAWHTGDRRLEGLALLHKPFAPDVLLRAVRRALDRPT